MILAIINVSIVLQMPAEKQQDDIDRFRWIWIIVAGQLCGWRTGSVYKWLQMAQLGQVDGN